MTTTGHRTLPRAALVNAVLRRVRAWTGLAGALASELTARLRDQDEVAELLAGARAEAVIRVPDAHLAADLLVLLDQLALYGGRRLSLWPEGGWAYRVVDASTAAPALPRTLLRQLAEQAVPERAAVPYQPWSGRIDRIAVITHDRPETLADCLAALHANLRHFGRRHVEVVVYDDSGPVRRPRVRSVVGDAASAGLPVRYVGPAEKDALRSVFERSLPDGDVDRPVLDRLLGAWRADGSWAGSAAEQRNWAILSAAGRRVLVCDDDVRPAALDATLPEQRAAATAAVRDAELRAAGTAVGRDAELRAAGTAAVRDAELRAAASTVGSEAGRLLAGHLAGRSDRAAPRPWPTDLLGILEETGPTLVSAAYTGHPDRRSALLLERFFVASERSIDVCDTDPPCRQVRQAAFTGGPRKFRGGAFVTSGTGEGVEFAVRRGRNEDFALAISLAVTTRGRPEPHESPTAFLLHERGPRHSGPFLAHRQEREGDLVNRLIEELGRDYAETVPGPFDPAGFGRYGLTRVDEGLDRAAAVLAGELFRDGLAYRGRAVAHLRVLGTVETRLGAAATGRALARLRTRWYADRATPAPALLRTAARLLRERRPLPAPVLAACVQVLVPAGIIAFMDVRSTRQRLRTLAGDEQAAAVAVLEREAGWCTGTGHRAGPTGVGASGGAQVPLSELAGRLAAKAARTRRLISEIDAELGFGSTPADRPPDERTRLAAQARFAVDVRARVRDEVRLFLRAVPYAYRLRSVLPALDGAPRLEGAPGLDGAGQRDGAGR
ncbi:hypothetical protein O7626_12665 [Micromonospora sp. WMMD1102]|uniref:hypothetical protein n=1 Tax=Micromonospora sp. WMMD1102 TaxID=3016105 RepID=UPI002414E3FC|nr:hypothetical protein [Micromonospora sp. WMMD1102]MDG4786774.1 hypothetical protein [Micromonospora sp. WMMD1102]